MLITTSPAPPPAPRRNLAGPAAPVPPQDPPPPPDSELGENVARWLGRGSQQVAMLPKLLDSRPWLLQKLNLEQARPALQIAAGLAGGVSAVSLATAGALDIDDGVRHNNYAEILSGSSDIARAGFVGGWTAGRLAGGLIGSSLLQTATALSFCSGALQTLGGLARMRQQGRDQNPISPKVVGALEAGMGATWMAATLGAPVVLCFVARMALATGKAVYTHHQDWQLWTKTDGRGKV